MGVRRALHYTCTACSRGRLIYPTPLPKASRWTRLPGRRAPPDFQPIRHYTSAMHWDKCTDKASPLRCCKSPVFRDESDVAVSSANALFPNRLTAFWRKNTNLAPTRDATPLLTTREATATDPIHRHVLDREIDCRSGTISLILSSTQTLRADPA